MNKEIRIAINLIVKNEEKLVANAINSVKSFADEIIVIDTGSTDNTPAICTRLGCEVYFHQWEDDFSKTRNYALEYTNADWVLIIDADEIASFTYEDLPLDIMNKPNIGGINLQIVSYTDVNNPEIHSTHRYTRLFRKNRNIRFSGSIHEQIRESIEKEFEIYDSELVIEHFGYKKIDKDKLARNTKLLEKDLENEDDDWKRYHLAETHFTAGESEKALILFQRILNSPELTEVQNGWTRIRLGQLYLANDDYNNAKEILDFVSEVPDTEGLRKYVLGTVMLYLGDIDSSLVLYGSEEANSSNLVDKSQLEIAIDGAKKFKTIIENRK